MAIHQQRERGRTVRQKTNLVGTCLTLLPSLVDFFRFYSREFPYNTGVVSIRAGVLKKESKGWLSEVSSVRIPAPPRTSLTYH